MAKKRRSNRKVHRGRRKKRGFSTWSLGKKIGVIFVSMLLVIVIGGGAAAPAAENLPAVKVQNNA